MKAPTLLPHLMPACFTLCFTASFTLCFTLGCQSQILEEADPASQSQTDDDAADAIAGTEFAPDSRASQGGIYGTPDGTTTDYEGAQSTGALGAGDLTVLMIVDRSGSMSAAWDGSTKWQIVRSSLEHAIVGVEEEVTIGALFFPMDEECEVVPFEDPRHIQLQSGELFQTRLTSVPDTLGGGTPMNAAFARADEDVTQAAIDGALEGRFRVVVMTDGEPNCIPDQEELVAFADSWRDLGVDVRVMGLPGSESAARLLDRIAGREVSEDEPYTPPPSVVDTSSSSEDTGYVAPTNSEDVDDSIYLVVR